MSKKHVPIQWIGYSPSGRRLGRIVDKGGFARYVTMDTTPGIEHKIEIIFDARHVNEDILYAMGLEYQRRMCISLRQVYENPRENGL